MAVQQEIIEVVVRGEKVEPTIRNMEKQMRELKAAADRATIGTKEHADAHAAYENAKNQLNSVKDELKGVQDATAGVSSELTNMIPFSGEIQKVTGTVSMLSKGFTTLRGAIISTGIGALIVLLGSLISYFQSSEEGQDKLNKIMKVGGIIVGNITDLFADMGEAIFKAFTNPQETVKALWEIIKSQIVNRIKGVAETFLFLGKTIESALSLDFDGVKENLAKTTEGVSKTITGVEDLGEKLTSGFEKAKDAMSGFVEETAKEMEAARKVADLEAQTNRMEREVLVEKKKIEAEIAELRLKARQDDEYTKAQQEQFLKEAAKLQDQIIEKDLQIAKNRHEIIKQTNTFSKSTKEDLDAEAAAEARLAEIQIERHNQARNLEREMKRVRQQGEAERKKQAEDRRKEEEAAAKAELAVIKSIEDLKVQAIADSGERQIAKINLDHERKIAALAGTEEQITEQRLLLEELRDNQLREAQEARDKKAEADKKASRDKQLEEIAIAEAMEAEQLELKFLAALQTEQERDQMMLDIKKNALQERLAVLEEAGLGETLQAMKFKGEILKIEKQKHDQSMAAEKAAADFKRRMQAEGYAAAHDFVNLGIELYAKDEAAKKKNAAVIKSFQKANILIDSAKEIQGIWMNANSNPLNALMPGAGAMIAGAQTGIALMRTRRAIQNVQGQSFFDGGFTGSGLTIGSGGKLKDGSGHTVAGVVHANEWVGPQWMTESPKYADIFRYLESERRGFAQGGFTTPPQMPAGNNPQGLDPQMIFMMVDLLTMIYEEMKSQNENISSWATNLHVNQNLTEVDKGLKMLYELKKDSAITR